MSYPGNTALPPDVQERIVQTFGQSLDLASAGKLQEARLGCDFVLRLDAQFAPAQKLQRRLADASGPIPVDDLRPGAQVAQESFADLGDLPDLDAFPSAFAPLAEVASLGDELRQLLAERNFRGIVEIAGKRRGEVLDDPELRRIAMLAAERLEAAPLIAGMVDGARAALDRGDRPAAEKFLGQARGFDPDHPDVLALEGALLAPDSSDLDDLDMPAFGSNEASFSFDDAPAPGLSFGDSPSLDQVPSLDMGGGLPSLDLGQSRTRPADPRIEELLGEGRKAFDRGEFQSAVDAWSRIFLIDIDHPEANRLIEEARRRKAEGERENEARFHEAQELADQGDRDGARAILTQLLARQPNHFAATELLESLDRPAGSVTPPRATEVSKAAKEVLQEEILVPPEPGAARPTRASTLSLPKPKKKGSGRKILLVAVGLLVLVGAAATGWWLLSSRQEIFPNAVEAPPPVAEEPSAIDKAQQLYESGKLAEAEALLQEIPPQNPLHGAAQALLTQWAGVAPAGPDPAIEAQRQAALETARATFTSGALLEAERLFLALAKERPLEFDDAEKLKIATARHEELRPLITYLQAGEFELALPELWKLHEANPADPDSTRLLVVGYYNLGQRELQRNSFAKAVEMFEEAKRLAPNDAEILRLLAFATTYRDRGEDLLSRTFIKYQQTRQP